jgi:hypothetical protein
MSDSDFWRPGVTHKLLSSPRNSADTSTWIGFFEGDTGEDTEMLAKALGDRQVVMSPPVLTELLSDPELSSSAARTLSEVPLIDIEFGYWPARGYAPQSSLDAETQSATRRRVDCSELYRRQGLAHHKRPGLPSVRRGCWSGPDGWVSG